MSKLNLNHIFFYLVGFFGNPLNIINLHLSSFDTNIDLCMITRNFWHIYLHRDVLILFVLSPRLCLVGQRFCSLSLVLKTSPHAWRVRYLGDMAEREEPFILRFVFFI